MSKAKQIIIDGKVINLTPETDSYFDENSENPVQNKVLHSKFNEIEGAFDDVNSAIDVVNSDISKIKNKLFPLEVTLSVNPSSAQEYTGANKNFTISWTTKIDGESVVPSKLELKVGTTNVSVGTDATSKIVTTNDDRKVELYVEAEGRSAKAEGSIKFAYPAYTGLVDDGFEISESNITKLIEMPLVDGRSRTYTYGAHSNKKIIYCYASAYGNLSQIIGPSNLDYMHLFEKTDVNINNIKYNVYIYTKINSTEGNLTYNYK